MRSAQLLFPAALFGRRDLVHVLERKPRRKDVPKPILDGKHQLPFHATRDRVKTCHKRIHRALLFGFTFLLFRRLGTDNAFIVVKFVEHRVEGKANVVAVVLMCVVKLCAPSPYGGERVLSGRHLVSFLKRCAVLSPWALRVVTGEPLPIGLRVHVVTDVSFLLAGRPEILLLEEEFAFLEGSVAWNEVVSCYRRVEGLSIHWYAFHWRRTAESTA